MRFHTPQGINPLQRIKSLSLSERDRRVSIPLKASIPFKENNKILPGYLMEQFPYPSRHQSPSKPGASTPCGKVEFWWAFPYPSRHQSPSKFNPDRLATVEDTTFPYPSRHQSPSKIMFIRKLGSVKNNKGFHTPQGINPLQSFNDNEKGCSHYTRFHTPQGINPLQRSGK